MINLKIPKVNNSTISSLSNIISLNMDNSYNNSYNNANTLSIGTEDDNKQAQLGGGWFWQDNSKCNIDKVALRCAKQNKFSFVSELILQDCIHNFGRQDEHKNTILHYLVSYKCKCELNKHTDECVIVNNAITKTLQHPKIKSFINIQNDMGDAPLHIATKLENSNLSDKLIRAGADKTIKNNDGADVKEVVVAKCEHGNILNSQKIASNINKLIAILNPERTLVTTKTEEMSNNTDEIFNDIIDKFVTVKQTGGFGCNELDDDVRCDDNDDIIECEQ